MWLTILFYKYFLYRCEKEKSALNNELQDVHSQLEQSKKQKTNADKVNRSLEDQIAELRSRLTDAETNFADSQNKYSKATAEGSNAGKLLEECEHKLGIATKNSKTLESNLAEARMQAEDESKVRRVL